MGVRRILVAVLLVGSLSSMGAPHGGAAPPEFVRGEASASADSVGLQIMLGNAAVGYTVGRSVARYQESLASADGRAIDLEALPLLFGDLTACPGVTPLLPKASLPPVTSIESTMSDAETQHRTEAFFPQLGGGQSFMSAGWQDASASPSPASWASTESHTADLGVFAIYGGRTEVRTELIGQLRKATAVFKADAISFVGGMVTIFNPRWTASATSGSSEKVEGSFDFDGGTLFGMFRTREQSHADVRMVADGLANILSLLGARLELPEVKIEGKSVKVTPMTFKLVNIPLGRLAIAPIITLLRDAIDQQYAQLKASGCQGETTAKLYQLLEGIVSGEGTVALPVGGVEARTDDTYYPPIELPGPPPPDEFTPAVAPEPDTFSVVETGGVAPTPYVPAAIPLDPVTDLFTDEIPVDVAVEDIVEEAAAPADEQIEFAAPASVRDRRFENGASGGVAAILGGAALLVGLGLAVADRLTMLRRRRRVIPS